MSLDFKTPLDAEGAKTTTGPVDLKATYNVGGKTLKWTKATARKKAMVNLDDALGRHVECIAYGYSEVESVHAREAVLKVGSDDGIQIWLNGQIVHTHDVGRGYSAGSDEVAVHLKSGVNRFLIKLRQGQGGWGFGVTVPPANF